MILHNIFNEIFSSPSNIAVLREISKVQTGLSGREIAKLVGISPPTCLSILTRLENLSLVKRQRGGRDHLFTLNREHIIVQEILLSLFSFEERLLNLILNDIKKNFGKYCTSIFLFGSVARKEEKVESDLDICFLINSIKSKKPLRDLISQKHSYYKIKYGVNLAPFFLTEKEFILRAKHSKPPVPDIVKDSMLIFGKSWEIILNG
ncbi:MAG: winged helix-turn-helix transcriptional regulator [Bacteroidetes bacterium]|nr:winged helix-turn-helix transcriptional regulator [Bacteroidota bacterium]